MPYLHKRQCATCHRPCKPDRYQCSRCVSRHIPTPPPIQPRSKLEVLVCPLCQCPFAVNIYERNRQRYCSTSCSSIFMHTARTAPDELAIWLMLHDPSHVGPSPVPGNVWARMEQLAPSDGRYILDQY